MNETATKPTWMTTRRRKVFGEYEIEFVPGAESGARAYFWLGRHGKYVASFDARELAAFIDKVRR